MFAFAEYPHTNAHVHYIKTNNRLPLQSVCVCSCLWYLQPYNVGYIPKITTTAKLTIFAVFVCVPCAVVDIWMMIYALSLPVCRVRAWQCFSRVEVWHILLCLIVFIQSLMFRYVILDLVYYFNRTLYRQCFCVYGRIFTREYLYIA